jgi:hypothetical protein
MSIRFQLVQTLTGLFVAGVHGQQRSKERAGLPGLAERLRQNCRTVPGNLKNLGVSTLLRLLSRANGLPKQCERFGKLPKMLPAFAKFGEDFGIVGPQSGRFVQARNRPAEIARPLERTGQRQPRLPILRQPFRPQMQDLRYYVLMLRVQTPGQSLGARMLVICGHSLGDCQAVLATADLKILPAGHHREERRAGGLLIVKRLPGGSEVALAAIHRRRKRCNRLIGCLIVRQFGQQLAPRRFRLSKMSLPR